jgi:hypothetical protein
MRLRNFTSQISSFFKTEKGKKVLKWSQRLINTGVFIWLIFQLSEIGWLNVWEAFPNQPTFYILFLFLFIQLPLFEVIIYRITWQFDALRSIPIFLVKRVYNKDVLGYSGEVYFFAWAKKTLHLNGKDIFKIIKDNNIISSIASTLISLGLLSIFIFTDQIKVIKWIATQDKAYFLGGLLLVVILVFLFVKFRHYVISMPLKTAYKIFGIQTFRLLLGQFVNLLMYYIVMPKVPFYIWFTFIAIEIILSRIPFLPNRDLIFAGMSISIAGGLPVAKEAIAGITLAKSVLNKVGSVASFGLANLFKQSDVVPNPDEEMEKTGSWEEQE